MPDPIAKLESNRATLLQALAATGDMRRGSITENFRACGKPTCACAASDHPGHGPYYALTTKVDGKTKTRQFRPGAELTKVEKEVAEYRRFRATCERLLEVNEAICDARPVEASAAEKKLRWPPRSKPRSSPRSKR
jgi:hypothetical protein